MAQGAGGGMWGQYPGYGGQGYGGQQGGYGGQMPGAYGGQMPFFDPSQMPGMGGDAQKKKKKKKKRAASGSSSSSSSSSSEDDDWRKKMFKQYQQMPGMWPGMQGQMPGMWPGMQGQWPQQGMPGPPGMPPPGGPPGGPPAPSSAPVGDGSSGSGGWQVASNEPVEVPIFLEAAVEEFVPVPKALLGKVIGKQASNIIEIREKSGAFKVDARDQSTDPIMVKVAGTAVAVKKAKELIMEILESTKTKHAGSEYVEIPRAKIGMVIGLKGAQVNEIQMQTGTKIDVDFEADPCRCYIKGGNPDSVLKAKQVLLTIAMQIEDGASEYLDLPKTSSGALIGAAGSRIREFQEQSGARIDIDKTGDRCRVRLTGTADQVANAKALVMYEVENAAKQSTANPGPSHTNSGPMVIPAHQPNSFPATLAESIARAKAAAQAVQSGMITTAMSGPETSSFAFPEAPGNGMAW